MDKLGDFLDRQKWFAPLDKNLMKIAQAVFDKAMGQKMRNFLHGTWLGHPLHPLITDVPLGAWTAATVCDVYELASGDESLARGSDVAVGIGLIGATCAAVTGFNDWHHTGSKPRRVGAIHGIINLAATACYLASWWQRRSGDRRSGLTTGFVGYSLSMAGAYLGGHLVFNERIGVNHAPERLSYKFVPVIAESKLRENVMEKAMVDDVPVIVVRRGKRIFVMAEKCSHLGAPLSEGKFDGETVTCPWHGSKFAIEDGRIVASPAVYVQPCFEVRVRDGQVEARAPRGMHSNPY